MAFKLNDRVWESSTSTGIGDISLSGSRQGYQTFAASLSNGDTTYYTVVADNGAWETGLGTYNSGTNSITRDVVYNNSSGNTNKISFAAGAKEVFLSLPADGFKTSSDIITYSQNGVGAVRRSIENKLRESVSVKDFGAVGDGVTDDTVAIQNAFAYIQSQGGGSIVFPKGTYNVACPTGSTLVSLTNLQGISIIGEGAVIKDTTTYSKTPSVQASTLFSLTDCLGVYVGPNITVESTTVYDGISSGSNSEGLNALLFNKGCRNIDVNATFVNCGRSAIHCTSAAGASGVDRIKGIRVRARVSNSRYGYRAAFNGDDADIDLETFNVGRVFFLFGVENYKIRVNGKNSRTSLIKSYGVGTVGSGTEVGYGCSNIEVWYTEKGGTTYLPAAELISIHWGDGRPATHRNIKLHMDTEEPAGSPWGNTISFAKYGPGDTTPDTTGRGHVLDGFEITGRMVKTTRSHLAQTVGTLVAPDVVRGIHIHDLVLVGGSSSLQMNIGAVADITHFTNVTTPHGLYSFSPIKTVYTGCQAGFFTDAANQTNIHDYVSCQITSGSLQNYSINKTFINTITPLGVLNFNASNIDSCGWTSKASKIITGDLTPTVNVFRIPTGTMGVPMGVLRVKYALAFDSSNFNPSTRREVYGIKSLSFTVNSSGVITFQTPVADEVTERTLGTSPAVVTVAGVNGNATDGAYISFSATDYNHAHSRVILEAELLGVGIFPSRIYPA